MTARLKRGAIAGTTIAMGLAFCGSAAAASAATPSRVTLDTTPSWTTGASTLGHTAANQQLDLSVVLNLRDARGAEALAAAVSTPTSPSYQKFLSAAQWRAAFAPTDAQVAAVTRWLAASGFTLGEIPSNHRYVSFTGTAAQAEKAFGTRLNDYSKAGQRVTANAMSVSVPSTVAATVAGVTGLDSSEVARPAHVDPAADAGATGAASTSAVARTANATPDDVLPPPDPVFRNAPPCSTYYGQKVATGVPQVLPDPLTIVPCGYEPHQIRGAYGVDAAATGGNTGHGVTVAVVDAYNSPTVLSDAQTYAARHDPAHPLLASQFSQLAPAEFTRTAACGAGGWFGEETLDVEAVHATAPGANILFVGARNCRNTSLDIAVNRVVDGSLAQVITNSYGSTGEPSSAAATAGTHQTFLQAAAQGISVLFSSGDNGDEKLDPRNPSGKRQVDYAASDPFVTAVGGTSLAVGRTDNYLFEQGWGTGSAVLTNGAWSPLPPAYIYGGGGGTSRIFGQPSYQKGVVPASISQYFGNAPHRAVPDVAMDADPNTGFLIGQTQLFPDGSLKYSEYRLGGTSLASPLFAGVVALGAAAAGHSLGFLNPALYSLAGSSAFHDVNHGRAVTDGVVRTNYVNGFDASAGTTTVLRTLNQTGSIYTRPGYDDVTGVGTPNGQSFISAIAAAG